MEFKTHRNGKYISLDVSEGPATIEGGLLDKSEALELSEKFREAAYRLEAHSLESSRVANFKEDVMTDICTCVDGFMEKSGANQEDVDKMKEALCQIVIDKVTKYDVM